MIKRIRKGFYLWDAIERKGWYGKFLYGNPFVFQNRNEGFYLAIFFFMLQKSAVSIWFRFFRYGMHFTINKRVQVRKRGLWIGNKTIKIFGIYFTFLIKRPELTNRYRIEYD